MSRKTKKASTILPMKWVRTRQREKYRINHPWQTTHSCEPVKGITLLVHYHKNEFNLEDHNWYSWNLYVTNRYPLPTRFGNHFIGFAKTLKEAKSRVSLAFIALFAQLAMDREQEKPWCEKVE
jgi:hypothetical protein